ncbi:TON1B [Arabidopsis thaliana]|uniref:TON1B n=1 Tax=Arabidopsis thaliana TaxID=3702 RepID=A0A178VAA3_ARATH|nr:TON1B [Arabidopsis thaliana]
MDDYTREMMDLKTLVTRTLEKKGVLAKIRFRASVFEAFEEEDRVIENNEGLPPALLGSCNDLARQPHASPGRLLSALICEYLDWAQLNHTLKVYQPECNSAKDSWKSEIRDFSINNGYELNRNEDSRPLLLDVLEGFLKFENMTQVMGGSSRRESETESSSSLDTRNPPRRSSASDSLPHQRRSVSASGAATSGYRKDESNWRYDTEDMPEEVMRASTALENLQLDRKTRNLTSSWRNVKDGTSEEEEGKD